MFITRDTGRDIKPVTRERSRLPLRRLLWMLDLLAIGALVGLVAANRIVVHQIAAYGEGRMVQVSVLLDLLDDFLPYLAGSMVAVSLLSLAALTATIVTRSVTRRVRATAIALLAAVVILSSLWWSVGRRSDVVDAAPPWQATPTAVAP